ncbi:hypothetical protein [Pseudomonas mandelii]|uniref:hypothetical protein n=1 Tax=Pseudomonas mandelii TaxID=75612 RepID=UPI00209F1803|nr:hypothetical protein [Pseudomonas mandelii]MCO8310227.1 hypothetical protein [Pseudomonas mandelii]
MSITLQMDHTGNFSDATFTFQGSTERQNTIYLHEAGGGGLYASTFARNDEFVLTASGLPGGQHSFALRTSNDNGKTFSEWFQLLNLNVGYSEKGTKG